MFPFICINQYRPGSHVYINNYNNKYYLIIAQFATRLKASLIVTISVSLYDKNV